MLSGIYVRVDASLDEATLRGFYQQAYANEPFVRVLPAGQLAAMAHTY
jgi:N-acetyl-gamma-glutamyl-phosphate reductase